MIIQDLLVCHSLHFRSDFQVGGRNIWLNILDDAVLTLPGNLNLVEGGDVTLLHAHGLFSMMATQEGSSMSPYFGVRNNVRLRTSLRNLG